VSYFTFLH